MKTGLEGVLMGEDGDTGVNDKASCSLPLFALAFPFPVLHQTSAATP